MSEKNSGGFALASEIWHNLSYARARAYGKGADMFRLSDRQGKLFDAYSLMTPHKKAACEKSWAGPFHEKALPILLGAEPEFPEELLADTNYSSAQNASEAAGRGVNLCAPAPARGKPTPGVSYPVPCDKCPTDKKEAGEWLKCREAQADFGKQYASRAGMEGTHSELKRRHGFRKLHFRGGARVKLVVYFKVTACNLKRAMGYWDMQRLKSNQAVEGAVAWV